jgi:hypothetical protein
MQLGVLVMFLADLVSSSAPFEEALRPSASGECN